jgi:hypothetical protein
MIFREIGVIGAIALVFGLGSYYATGEAGAFAAANLALGAIAVLVAAAGGLRSLRVAGSPAARRLLAPRLAQLVGVIVAAVALHAVATHAGWRLDWTREERFRPAEATEKLLAGFETPVEMTFYHQGGDPRARRTGLLLRTLARDGRAILHERLLEDAASEADQFGVASSEAVVIRSGDRFETVDRPTEGSIYEALWRLRNPGTRTLYATLGEGEGDLASLSSTGYSGLRTMLETEGFEVRDLVTAAGTSVPAEAGGVLVVGPQRTFSDEGVAALDAYLAAGGGLVALLEPGIRSGLEPLLERYGFELPDGVIVDPPSGAIAGGRVGLHPIASTYSEHAVTRGLSGRTLSLFLEARPVVPARKPEPDDVLRPLLFSSPEAWLAPPTPATLRGDPGERPPGVEPQRWPFAAAGEYPRGGRLSRIVVFGDSSFADNAHLRALYNLDLLMNAVHWVVQREEAIALRPKILTPNQDPLTPQQSLAMLYGVGLLLPELLLILGAIVWLRRRAA